ncbi:DoxX family protein [Micromonospora sp. NPDC093244]|uniref:DoxX family protein n=1 Tax=Micromonospora sp. NPDC093244 TaxID=3155071 RepID=UPI003413052D
MTDPAQTLRTPPVSALTIGLWAAQGALALIFAGGGVWKIVTPIERVAEAFAWAGEVPPGLFYATAALDILGGIGVLLPSLTRIRPGVTVLAALGCVALQASAIVFHLSRGEAADAPVNVLFIALALFVAWGRHSMAPIAPRA